MNMFVSFQRNACTCFCNTIGSCYEVTADCGYNTVPKSDSASVFYVVPVTISLNGTKPPKNPLKKNEAENIDFEYHNMAY